MSTEAEFEAIINHVTSSIGTLAGNAAATVASAVAVAQQPVVFPRPPTKIVAQEESSIDGFHFAPQTKAAPGLPPWINPEWPTAPETKSVPDIEVGELPDAPTLQFPTFSYPLPSGFPQFTGDPPDHPQLESIPLAPDLTPTFTPRYLPFGPLPGVSLAIGDAEFLSAPAALGFDAEVFARTVEQHRAALFSGSGELPGISGLQVEIQSLTNTALTTLLPALIDELRDRFTNRYAYPVKNLADIENRMQARAQAEQARVSATLIDRSGWDVPDAIVAAQQATVDQIAAGWQAQIDAGMTVKSEERALALFQHAAETYVSLSHALIQFLVRAGEEVINAHQWAVEYAKQSINALLAVFDAQNYRLYDVEFKQAEVQLALFEARLSVNTMAYEVAQAEIEGEQGRQAQDKNLIAQYAAESEQLQLDQKVLAGQVAAARTELALKGIPFDIMEARLRAFETRVTAHLEQVKGLEAEIRLNNGLVDGQLKIIDGFVAETDGFEAEVRALRQAATGKSETNQNIIEEFRLRVKAALAPVSGDLAEATYDLAAYRAQAESFLTDARLAIRQLEQAEKYLNAESKGQAEAYRLTREQILDIATTEAARLGAIAEVNAQGAEIIAGMAEGAMSAATGIASVIFEEF